MHANPKQIYHVNDNFTYTSNPGLPRMWKSLQIRKKLVQVATGS